MIAIGTRPEAIKLAPVADALKARGIYPALLFTGQHPLQPSDFGLQNYAFAELACAGGGDPQAHALAVAEAAAPHLSHTSLLIVQGDTSSALGAALGAVRARVPVAHVEAGLRSHDRRRPWPEEDFRLAIDGLAQLLFAPTELSAVNLRREGVRGRIEVTGNTGIDAVLRARAGASRASGQLAGPPILLVTCHRRESWGAGLANIAGALRAIAEQRIATITLLLHPNPATASHVRALMLGCSGITLLPPLGHEEAIAAMLAADCVLSDSGGMQEECAALGVPMLVLRQRTERPEAIASGQMALAGTEPAEIVGAVERLLRRPRSPGRETAPYGDGQASERIAAVVADWLENTAEGRATGPRVSEVAARRSSEACASEARHLLA